MANICLDVSPVVHGKAGLASYARELAEHLVAVESPNRYSLFHYDAHPPVVLSRTLAALPCRSVALSARWWRLGVAAATLAGPSLDRLFPDADLFHATEHLLPPLRRVRTVFTFHDAIYALFPKYHLPMNRAYLGLMMPRFLRRADAIITISECSRRDASRLYGIAPERFQVIYEGVDARFRPVEQPGTLEEVRRRYGLPNEYLLAVGTIEPRKNLSILLDAFLAVKSRSGRQDLRLVIVGKKGWLYQEFFRRLTELGLDDGQQVVFPGYVADEDLPAVYAGAACFVFPSIYEGFGLPVLEAMASGAPVVCSSASSLPEVAGDAALMVKPDDTGAFATAVERVLADGALRGDLRARGLRRASQFTWERTAQQTVEVYARVLEAGPGSRPRPGD
jgi:glycosyltransferase involved in cell wall biosynthesis